MLPGATVSGGTVGALSLLERFNVSGTVRVETTFYPPGFVGAEQGLSGSARLYGDVEYRGQGLNRSAGEFYGFVDAADQRRHAAAAVRLARLIRRRRSC